MPSCAIPRMMLAFLVLQKLTKISLSYKILDVVDGSWHNTYRYVVIALTQLPNVMDDMYVQYMYSICTAQHYKKRPSDQTNTA
jgi:hypothetical protein